MPRIAEMLPSKYIKKEEVETPVLGTVRSVSQYNVAKQNEPAKPRWCVEFLETTPPLNKPLVLNATKMSVLKEITGSDSSDAWTGAKVVIYHDPEIKFGVEKVGGTALRAPKNQQPQAAPIPADAMDHMQQQHANDIPDDEIPF